MVEGFDPGAFIEGEAMNYIENLVLSDKLEELYHHLRYYGVKGIKKGVLRLYYCPDEPIINHWSTVKEMICSLELFRKLSVGASLEEFKAIVTSDKMPKGFALDRDERILWLDREERLIQARFVLDFLLSLNDIFEIDVDLFQHGFIHWEISEYINAA